MIRRFLTAVFALTMVPLTACDTGVPKGEATLYRGSDFLVATLDELRLPSSSLSVAGPRTFRLRDLPEPVFPDALVVEARRDDDPADAPWRSASVRIEFLQPGADEPFFEISVDLADHEPVFEWTRQGPTYIFGFPLREDLPPLTDYDVRSTVEGVSPRPGDAAHLRALFSLERLPEDAGTDGAARE